MNDTERYEHRVGPAPSVLQFDGCEFRLPGHRHCVHVHTTDCPHPEDCDLIDEAQHRSYDREHGETRRLGGLR